MDSSHKLQYWTGKILKWILRIGIVIFVLICIVLIFFSWQASNRESKTITEVAPSTGHFVKANDTEIFVQEVGPASGQPVLLIHGTGAWSEIWRDTMKVLSEKGFHAIALMCHPLDILKNQMVFQPIVEKTRLRELLGCLIH